MFGIKRLKRDIAVRDRVIDDYFKEIESLRSMLKSSQSEANAYSRLMIGETQKRSTLQKKFEIMAARQLPTADEVNKLEPGTMNQMCYNLQLRVAQLEAELQAYRGIS